MRKKFGYLIMGLAAGLSVGAYAFMRARSHPMRNHPFLQAEGVLVIAHRGGQGLWPPNTMYAFEHAVDMGVDILELDIHSTADGVLVVRHDPTVDATTNGSGAIKEMTLAEVKALDAGYRWTADGGETFPYRGQGITIPTLEEVLTAFPHIRVNIDIKPEEPDVVEPFCKMLRQYGRLKNVLVGSFHDHQLRRFRELCPEVATAAGVSETRLFFALNWTRLDAAYPPSAEAFQIPEYSGWLHVVTPHFIQGAHMHNMQVHIWTVNDTQDMQRLIEWGAEGIITDYPDRLLVLLGRKPPRAQ